MNSPSRRRPRWWLWPLVVVVAVLAWVNVGPTSLGGNSVYLVTSGISMEPRFHSGDLAVLQPATTYSVGEIVGYRSPHIGVVLHRIIGEVDGRFIMKGDHNDFVDTYHPSPSDIVGRLVLHVPSVGKLVSTRTGRDAGLALVGLSMVGVVGVPTVSDRRRRRERRRRESSGGSGAAWRTPVGAQTSWGVLGVPGQVTAALFIIVALLALLVGADAFTHAPTSRLTTSTPYQQRGVWSYTAPASGTVYPGQLATTGDPLYEAVAPVAHVAFTYSLSATVPAAVSGTGYLTAVVGASDGWSHTISVGGPSTLTSSGGVLRGVVNLLSVNQYLAGIVAQTRQTLGSALTYTLTLVPHLDLRGTVALAPVTLGSFAPPLVFDLYPNEAQLVVNAPTSSEYLVTHPSSSGSVAGFTTHATPLVILGHHTTVTPLRRLVLWILGVDLVLLLALGAAVRRARRGPEISQILSRYGDVVLSVKGSPAFDEEGVTDLASMEDLVRLAELQGRLVLFAPEADPPVFFVRDLAMSYRYEPRTVPVPAAPSGHVAVVNPQSGPSPVSTEGAP